MQLLGGIQRQVLGGDHTHHGLLGLL
jgi:hypothetical protein